MWRAIETTDATLLVVRGAESDLLSRETVADMVRRGRHVTHAEIPGVGHAPAFVDAEQIALARRFFVETGT